MLKFFRHGYNTYTIYQISGKMRPGRGKVEKYDQVAEKWKNTTRSWKSELLTNTQYKQDQMAMPCQGMAKIQAKGRRLTQREKPGPFRSSQFKNNEPFCCNKLQP